jgi:hypothetical protein
MKTSRKFLDVLFKFPGRRLIRGKENSSPLEPAPCTAGTGHLVPGAVQDDRLVLAAIHPRVHHRIASAAHPDDGRRRPSEAAREIVVQIALVPILMSFLLGTFFQGAGANYPQFRLALTGPSLIDLGTKTLPCASHT